MLVVKGNVLSELYVKVYQFINEKPVQVFKYSICVLTFITLKFETAQKDIIKLRVNLNESVEVKLSLRIFNDLCLK